MALITIEGIDGAGKSTLAAALAREIPGAVLLREPGGVGLSERLREVVKDPALTVGPRAEALIYAAARAQLVEEAVRPALERGETVLLDRFVDSSLAYQGAGRGLGVDAVRAINDFATGGLRPDRTLLLRIDPAVGRARAPGAARRRTGSSGRPTPSSPRSPPPTTSWPPAIASASSCSTPPRRPTGSWRTRCARWAAPHRFARHGSRFA